MLKRLIVVAYLATALSSSGCDDPSTGALQQQLEGDTCGDPAWSVGDFQYCFEDSAVEECAASCPASSASSAAFFLSPEFQQTGSLSIEFQETGYLAAAGTGSCVCYCC
jgi:hypothetical protein